MDCQDHLRLGVTGKWDEVRQEEDCVEWGGWMGRGPDGTWAYCTGSCTFTAVFEVAVIRDSLSAEWFKDGSAVW